MKLRHVRAVAVFGIAVVALTGARGSHGGSCGGGSSHSSGSGSSGSSSTSGGTTGGSHDNDTTSSSSSSGGTTVSGASGKDKAERDIRIDACKLDAAGKNLVAKLTVTNSGSLDQTYNITMKFRGDAAATASNAQARVSGFTVKAGASRQTEATTPYTGKGDGSEFKECVVASASKSSL